MPDDKRLSDGLTEIEMQLAAGGARPMDQSEVPGDDTRRIDAADLQQVSGGARAATGSEVPTDDGRVDAVDLRQISGGSNAMTPSEVPDDGTNTHERIHGLDIQPL